MKNRIVVLLKICNGDINPFDATALECALTLKDINKDYEVFVVSMSPITYLDKIENLSRYNVKTYLVSDSCYAGSDTIATSYILSNVIKTLKPQYVFCGKQSVDGDTSQVPTMIAERLKYNIYTNVSGLKDGLFIFDDNKSVDYNLNCIFTFNKFVGLRPFSIFSKKEKTIVLNNDILKLDPNFCGGQGSKTKVVKTYESLVGKRFCKFINYNELDDIIKTAKNKEKTSISKKYGFKIDKIGYCGNIDYIAKSLANDTVLLKGDTIEKFIQEIQDNDLTTILFSDTEKYKELASRIAVNLDAGLCADCIDFSEMGGKLVMIRPACAGNVTAEIISTTKYALATVKTPKENDNDIIFCIGNGAKNKISQITELAKKYNAKISATRIMVDNGYFPYSYQVGLTGKTVAPKIYVCFGVSGAVQHTSAIENAGTIIAINNDKNARIFSYADYGILMEI